MDRFPRLAIPVRLAIVPARLAIPALLVAAASCLPGAAGAQRPDPPDDPDSADGADSLDVRVSVTGVVYDILSGTAIPSAAVSIANGRQAVLANREGFFRLDDVEAGPQLLVVTQFGYQKKVVATTVAPGSGEMMQVALTPRPIMLSGITATVENITEMEARLRFRRRAAASSAQAFDRNELFRAMSGTPLDFLERRTMVRVIPCPPGSIGARCVWRRGRAIEPWVYVDEAVAFGGLDELESYPVSDIYLMEVYSWGSEIRVYTNRFMERMARKPMMLIPLNLWPRPAR